MVLSSSSNSSSKSSSSSSNSSVLNRAVARVDLVEIPPPHVSPGTVTACSFDILSTIGSVFHGSVHGTVATTSNFAILSSQFPDEGVVEAVDNTGVVTGELASAKFEFGIELVFCGVVFDIVVDV